MLDSTKVTKLVCPEVEVFVKVRRLGARIKAKSY